MIFAPEAVDHTIALDCKFRIIYNSENLYALRLTKTAVLAFLDDGLMSSKTLCSAKRSKKFKISNTPATPDILHKDYIPFRTASSISKP